MTNINIKMFIFMLPKQPCRLSHVFHLKNKIFEISWVFEPSGLTERDEKYYIHNIYTTLLQQILSGWLLIMGKKVISLVVSNYNQ